MDLKSHRKLKVGIIGAGVAGLSSALLLNRLGCDVTVFEKEKALRREGAGIQITSNGLLVLEKLDLDELVTNFGLKPNNLCLFDTDETKRIGKLEILNRSKTVMADLS